LFRSIPQKDFSDDENGGFASTAAQCTVTYMSSGAQQNRHLQFDKMFLRSASYTERAGVVRIISARRANKREEKRHAREIHARSH
jgi:hypothetical protein